jgi:hypothetical protein
MVASPELVKDAKKLNDLLQSEPRPTQPPKNLGRMEFGVKQDNF